MLTDRTYDHNRPFELESGSTLPDLRLHYTTYGKLNNDHSNVVWVCHAFSGSSDFTQWWPGLFGEGKLYDPNDYFVVCVNMPGGCYGSTGPLSVNPETGEKYHHDFPLITNRDMVRAFDLVRRHMGIGRIHTVIGCSMGGQHAVEWAVQQPDLFEHVVAIGANARHSPWAVAFNETQRMAIEADPTWNERRDDAGMQGMKAARAVGLLSYRSYACYEKKQNENADEVVDGFRAASYQQYQGFKITQRFNAFTYWYLSKAMDSQNVGRGRGNVQKALQRIKAKSLFVGIDHDILFPSSEQRFLADQVRNGTYSEVESFYGHDGFLIEFEKLTDAIRSFYNADPLSSTLYRAV